MPTKSLDIVLGAKDQTSPAFINAVNHLRGLENAAKESAGRMHSAFSSVFAGIGLSVGNAMTNLLGNLIALPGKAVAAAHEAMDAERKLDAVLTATGHAAGFTTDQLKDQAAQLQRLTTFDDDAVVGFQAVLATFKNIKGDVFRDATAAALDMSTVMGQDLQASAVQLGKALNDPILGVTALRKVGVSFTESQIAMIKSLQDSGQMMQAQKIILGELQSEFGGAAEAVASTSFGRMAQLGNQIGDLMESIGTKIMDAASPFISLASAGVTALSGIFESVSASAAGWIEGIRAPIAEAFAWWSENVAPIIFDAFEYFRTAVVATSEMIGASTGAMASAVASAFAAIGLDGSTLGRFFSWLGETVRMAFITMQFAMKNWKSLMELGMLEIGLSIVTFTNELQYQFTEVIPAVLVWFYENWRDIFKTIWDYTTTVFKNLYDNAVDFVANLITLIAGGEAEWKWTALTDGFEASIKELPHIVERNKGAMEKAMGAQVDALKGQLGHSFDDYVKERLTTVASQVGGLFQTIVSAFANKPAQPAKALGKPAGESIEGSGGTGSESAGVTLPSIIEGLRISGLTQAAMERQSERVLKVEPTKEEADTAKNTAKTNDLLTEIAKLITGDPTVFTLN
jgi:hypothetical protein